MVSNDAKIFWKYILHEQLNLKKFIGKPIFYEYLSVIILVIIVINKSTSLRIKGLFVLVWFIFMTFLKFYSLYKSGIHRGWNRERIGILTKSQLKKIKEERYKKEPKEMGLNFMEEKDKIEEGIEFLNNQKEENNSPNSNLTDGVS